MGRDVGEGFHTNGIHSTAEFFGGKLKVISGFGGGAKDACLVLDGCWSYRVYGSLRTGNGSLKQPTINGTTASMTAYSFDSAVGGL